MASGQNIGFACTCGLLCGTLTDASPRKAVRGRCFCADCRAAELYHDQPDPGDGGVDLVMVDPATLSIDRGQDHLAAIRLYPKGIVRWYADCCGARLFNTLATARFVFITIVAARIAYPDALGREQSRTFVRQSDGTLMHEHAARLYMPMIRRSLIGFLTGRRRDNPLFDRNTGQLGVTPHILTRDERRALGLKPKTSVS